MVFQYFFFNFSSCFYHSIVFHIRTSISTLSFLSTSSAALVLVPICYYSFAYVSPPPLYSFSFSDITSSNYFEDCFTVVFYIIYAFLFNNFNISFPPSFLDIINILMVNRNKIIDTTKRNKKYELNTK